MTNIIMSPYEKAKKAVTIRKRVYGEVSDILGRELTHEEHEKLKMHMQDLVEFGRETQPIKPIVRTYVCRECREKVSVTKKADQRIRMNARRHGREVETLT